MVLPPSKIPNDTFSEMIPSPFFADISIAALHTASNTQDGITGDRAVEPLRSAIISVIWELATLNASQQFLGDGATPLSKNDEGDRTAAYAMAKAQLIKYYNDLSACEEKIKRYIGFRGAEVKHCREACESIRRILNEPHLTVELI